MASNKTRYVFKLPDGGMDEIGRPTFTTWVRTFSGNGTDAPAEAFARRLSEEHEGRSIEIHRAGANWAVDCGFIPRREG